MRTIDHVISFLVSDTGLEEKPVSSQGTIYDLVIDLCPVPTVILSPFRKMPFYKDEALNMLAATVQIQRHARKHQMVNVVLVYQLSSLQSNGGEVPDTYLQLMKDSGLDWWMQMWRGPYSQVSNFIGKQDALVRVHVVVEDDTNFEGRITIDDLSCD